MSYGERLKRVRKYLGMTQAELAEALEVKNKQTISDIETGKQQKLMSKNEIVLTTGFDISPTYLQVGGEMLKELSHKAQVFGRANRSNISVCNDEASADMGNNITLEYYPESYASAGGGAYAYLAKSKPMSFSKSFLELHLGLSSYKDLFILNTTGESMEPTLKDGSLIFVNPIENEDDVVRDGGIYVLMCENTMLVKRIRVNPIDKTYTLISDHPEHDSITIAFFHESGCSFVGRVVGSFDRV